MHLHVLVGLPTWYSILKCTAKSIGGKKQEQKNAWKTLKFFPLEQMCVTSP